MNQGCVVKENVVSRAPGSFVAEIERWAAVNEVGGCRRGEKDGLAVECSPEELDSIPASARELLCDTGQVTSNRLFSVFSQFSERGI